MSDNRSTSETTADAEVNEPKNSVDSRRHKMKKKKENEVEERAVEVNSRELVCSPEHSGKNAATVISGMIMRFAVLAFSVFSVVFFLSDAFKIQVSPTVILLGAFVPSLLFALTFGVRQFRIAGILLSLTGIGCLFVLFPGPYALIYYYNAMLGRLIDAQYYGFISKQIHLVESAYSNEYLLGLGAVMLCVLTAAIFVPLLIKKSNIRRMLLPATEIALVVTLVFTYNISRSNWAFTFLVASICGLMIMLACDRIFAFRTEKQSKDASGILFEDEERPQFPEEYLNRKEAAKRRKLAKAEKRKKGRELKKLGKTVGVSVDEEIDSYLFHSDKGRKSSERLTPQEKKLQKLDRKKHRAQIKKERSDTHRAYRRAVNRAKNFDDSVAYSRSSAGGFAAFGACLLTLIVLFIPSLKITKYFTFERIDKKLEAYREYITAWLRGDDPVLDLLDYANDRENFKPHTTDAYPRYYKNIKLFEVNTQADASVYLRGWIGVDFKDGSWYPAYDETLSEYRKLFGTTYDPKEIMFYRFFNLMAPETVEYTDYVTRYNPNSKYGFVAMQVNLKREKTGSMYTNFASYYDTDIGLLNYGTNEKSGLTYVNFFDGIYTGRKFKEASEYATVSYVTTMKNKSWIKNVSKMIAEYNRNKYYIESYRSDPDFSYDQTTYEYIDEITGKKVVSFLNPGGHRVTVYYNDDGSIFSYEISEETYEVSLFVKYRELMTKEERADLDYTYRIDNLYSGFVYDTYLGYEKSNIISDVLGEIISQINAEDEEQDLDIGLAAERASQNALTYSERNRLVMGIIDWLKNNTEYTLTPNNPTDNSLNGIENFLTVGKQGYCVQYASTVAVMLRECGIPARYVEGYIGSNLKYDRYYSKSGFRYNGTVLDRDLHAWVEVWYDGLGWIQYECTPPYYDAMYTEKNSEQSSGVTRPDDNDEKKYEFEQDELYRIKSDISYYQGRLDKIEEIFLGFGGLFGKNELMGVAGLREKLSAYEEEFNASEEILNNVLSGKITDEEFNSSGFIRDVMYLGSELDTMEEPISSLEYYADYYTELYDKIVKIAVCTVISIVVVSIVVLIFIGAAKVSKKKIRSIEGIINGNVSPEERRNTALSLIDGTEFLLKIYGSAPRRGEFRDEYAKRLSFEYETLFGFPSEYANDEDIVARNSSKKQNKQLKKAYANFKSKDGKNKNISADPQMWVSDVCISDILDSVAAEEFGGEMTDDEVKRLAVFYSKLYGASRTRLSFVQWLYRHCIRHQV